MNNLLLERHPDMRFVLLTNPDMKMHTTLDEAGKITEQLSLIDGVWTDTTERAIARQDAEIALAKAKAELKRLEGNDD